MCPTKIVLWCFVLLLVALFSKSQGNSTNDNERSDYSTMRYDHFVSSMKNQNDEMETTQCNSCENSIKNDDEMQSVNSTRDDHKNDDLVRYHPYVHIIKNREESNQMSMESHANLTEVNSTLQEINENLRKKTEGESDFTNSNEFYRNSSADDYNNNTTTTVPYEACHNVTCIQLCCPFGNSLTERGRCVAGQDNYSFPSVFTYGNDSEDKRLNKLFRLTVHNPCTSRFEHRLLDGYIFLVNGSLHKYPYKLISPKIYCLAIFKRNIYDVIICLTKQPPSYVSVCALVSLPFLLLTFVVYSILPELQNMHGYTLRAHMASLFVTYAILYFRFEIPELVDWRYCVPLGTKYIYQLFNSDLRFGFSGSKYTRIHLSGLWPRQLFFFCASVIYLILSAYIFNFSFLSSFFWLNVTCFDIWWTFRQVRSYQIKQDKKKFVIYSLYAWGITFILNVICAIMDYAPGIPKSIRPEMCKKKFWFSEKKAKTMYFYIPMSITIISNVCFFIATMVTILYQNIHTTHQLRDSESKRHNENKQRFNMYLKLFIVMGISWIMEMILWFVDTDPVVSYLSNTINSLQGVIIFIIFVCRKKIKKLLLKKFGEIAFCKIPTNNDSMTSTTSTLASGTLPMQEINSSN